jgi:hypothetical protein
MDLMNSLILNPPSLNLLENSRVTFFFLKPVFQFNRIFFGLMAISEAQAVSLLNFDQPLDVNILDGVLGFMHGGGPQVAT